MQAKIAPVRSTKPVPGPGIPEFEEKSDSFVATHIASMNSRLFKMNLLSDSAHMDRLSSLDSSRLRLAILLMAGVPKKNDEQNEHHQRKDRGLHPDLLPLQGGQF